MIGKVLAKAKLNALLAEVERTGTSVTIANHGLAVALLVLTDRARVGSGSCPRLPCRMTLISRFPTRNLRRGRAIRDCRLSRVGACPILLIRCLAVVVTAPREGFRIGAAGALRAEY